MSNSKPGITRRQFVIRTVAGLAATTVAGRSFADGHNRLAEDDPTAVALGYKHDGADVDKEKFPKYTPEQNCLNCALYQGEGEWAGCGIFAGKEVKGTGWCSAWAPRP